MTFEDLARSFLAPADPEDIMELAGIIQEAYCDGLRACAYRRGGIMYVFDGPYAKQLDSVIELIKKTGKPL